MKIFMILMLSCLSVLAADEGVRMTSVLSTNAEGTVRLEETFTRDGQKNLVRETSMKKGVVTGRSQTFFQRGEMVAVHTWWIGEPGRVPRESFFTSHSSYMVVLDFSPKKEIQSLSISGKEPNSLDMFSGTNGMFYPLSNAEIKALKQKE